MKKVKSNILVLNFFLFNFGINENSNVIILTFNFHFCKKRNGYLGTWIDKVLTRVVKSLFPVCLLKGDV